MSKTRLKKRLVSLGLWLAVVLTGWAAQKNPQVFSQLSQQIPAGYYQVVNVDDGDTIVVNMNGKKETVRFIGVDTPEIHDPRKAVQCFGQAASNYTKGLIGSSTVRLEADPLSTNRDRYNRLLRYIYLPDGRLVEAEIIKNGYGFAYTSFPFTKSQEFLNLQSEARQNQRGLWHDCQPMPNSYGGFTSNNQTN
jgi:micrococcal nuclease